MVRANGIDHIFDLMRNAAVDRLGEPVADDVRVWTVAGLPEAPNLEGLERWGRQRRRAGIRLRYVRVRSGRCWSMGRVTPRSGRRQGRLQPRLAARRRRCVAVCGRRSGIGPAGWPEQRRARTHQGVGARGARTLQANEILRKASAYFAVAEPGRRSKP